MRLLLAEDEKSLSKALVKILEHSNYSVDAVYDGREALDYITGSDYDGIILDVMMPKLDGFEVLKEIRKKGVDTPVLMLTARSGIDDKVFGLDSGANDYLTKPFDTKELLARVRAMTRSGTQTTDSVIRTGSVSLDRVTFELSCGDESIKLANKEFQVLELLMTNPSMVVSTDKLFEKIWGLDSDADTSIVWVYISNLRKKLNSLNADIRIKAARNIGYSIEVIPNQANE
jgi:two-component system response regulator ArlR